jgi:beta-lactamase regulating signal transducer with metallopeptidase domain
LSASALYLLVASSIAATAAVLIVALIRKPLRKLSGPQAACWIWLLVPALTLVVFLPAPSRVSQFASQISPSTFALTVPAAALGTATHYASTALWVWLPGCALMAIFIVGRQIVFVRSLRSSTRAADGTYRSASVSGPLLIGVWRPRIIVPGDFDVRYGVRERALMLAHEHAHLRRGDILTSAIAMIWPCVFWFNPLMYWAVSRLRFDQELACDAIVLAGLQCGRRQYAHTLIKAQVAADSPWRIPISCHWLSAHPLQERIAMLKQPFPGFARRSLGIFLTLALIFAGSGIVWAAQSESARATMAQQDDLRFEFSADRMLELPNGDMVLSGNVAFAPVQPGASKLSYEADRITQTAEAVLPEGAVRISLGRYTLTTDRATVEKDGTVRMAEALMSRALNP